MDKNRGDEQKSQNKKIELNVNIVMITWGWPKKFVWVFPNELFGQSNINVQHVPMKRK